MALSPSRVRPAGHLHRLSTNESTSGSGDDSVSAATKQRLVAIHVAAKDDKAAQKVEAEFMRCCEQEDSALNNGIPDCNADDNELQQARFAADLSRSIVAELEALGHKITDEQLQELRCQRVKYIGRIDETRRLRSLAASRRRGKQPLKASRATGLRRSAMLLRLSGARRTSSAFSDEPAGDDSIEAKQTNSSSHISMNVQRHLQRATADDKKDAVSDLEARLAALDASTGRTPVYSMGGKGHVSWRKSISELKMRPGFFRSRARANGSALPHSTSA